jgi:hypothetical protein
MQLVEIRAGPTFVCTSIGKYSPHSYPPLLDKVENQPHLPSRQPSNQPHANCSRYSAPLVEVNASGVVSLGELSS